MKKIKNEEQFLYYLIKHSDESGCIYQYDCVKNTSLTEKEVILYAKSLIFKGYITSDISNYYITELGKQHFQKSKFRNFFRIPKFLFKPVVRILFEIFVSLVIAYLIWQFGWQ